MMIHHFRIENINHFSDGEPNNLAIYFADVKKKISKISPIQYLSKSFSFSYHTEIPYNAPKMNKNKKCYWFKSGILFIGEIYDDITIWYRK